MQNKRILVVFSVLILIALSFLTWSHFRNSRFNGAQIYTKQVSISPNNSEMVSNSADNQGGAPGLGNYNVLISDRGNNRIIEVTPQKQVVWEYNFTLPKAGLGADDAFFTDGGKSIIANLEEYQILEQIDVATKQVTWSYGVAGKPGSDQGYLNTPDDAYKLPNGDYTVADIKNCRVIEISPSKQIVRQYGVTKKCGDAAGQLDLPNGDTPVAGGNTLISNIVGHNLLELNSQWQKVLSIDLPTKYPSDPQLTKDGNFLVADYSKPGKIVEVNPQGQLIWSYQGTGEAALDHPSLAIELPNGNILATDDYNHRIVVIDKQTKQIDWQYGTTGKPGRGFDQLNIPDGLDITPADQNSSPVSSLNTPAVTQMQSPIYSVGQVSRHAANYLNQKVQIKGYVIKTYPDYVIISDEKSGAVGLYDLPVRGYNAPSLQVGNRYTFVGQLENTGLTAANKNPNHLELANPAQ